MFEACYAHLPRQVPLKFARPGAERQDSVYSGFQVGKPWLVLQDWAAMARSWKLRGMSRAAGQQGNRRRPGWQDMGA